MGDVRYDLNPAGVNEVVMGEQMAEVMNAYAHVGIGVFETIAPRRSNRYAESAEVIDAVDAGHGRPRRVAHIVATVDYAAKLEFGDTAQDAAEGESGGRRKAHHTLARVADALEAL